METDLSKDQQLAGVIFDLDGTLLDTLADLTDAVNFGLEQLSAPPRTEKEVEAFIGDGAPILISQALPEEVPDQSRVEACLGHMMAFYGEHWARKTQIYEGIGDVLASLTAQGIPMAVLSNKPDEFVADMVDRFFPSKPFTHAWGIRPGHPKKPDPEVALEIAAAWQLSAEKIAFVGDSAIDIETARAAKMLKVAVSWGFRRATDLREHEPDLLFETPKDLLTLFS